MSKSPREYTKKLGESTDFQLHKSQQTILSGDVKHILDYTEHRLLRMIDLSQGEQETFYQKLLDDYVSGRIAIAWKQGQPAWTKITKA